MKNVMIVIATESMEMHVDSIKSAAMFARTFKELNMAFTVNLSNA